MKLQPLLTWWLILPYLIAAVSVATWQFWRIRPKKQAGKTALRKQAVQRWLRRSALLVLPVLIAIGPSVQGGVSAPGVANLDVMFVVDTTPSMGAIDYAGKKQRIEGVKQDMLAIASSLQGAHMQIVTFASEASVILPLTTDVTAFSAAVEGMTPEIYSYSQGSTIDKPIELVARELKSNAAAYPEHYRLLFYIGDGEQTTERPVKSFAIVAQYLSGGAVLGYGTTQGAQIVKYTGNFSSNAAPTYITTVDSAANQLVPAISSANTTALQKIAKELRIPYQNRNQGGPVDELYEVSRAALAVDRSQKVVHYLNLYWLLAIPFVALIFWEWQTLIVRLFELRQRHKDKDTQHGKA